MVFFRLGPRPWPIAWIASNLPATRRPSSCTCPCCCRSRAWCSGPRAAKIRNQRAKGIFESLTKSGVHYFREQPHKHKHQCMNYSMSNVGPSLVRASLFVGCYLKGNHWKTTNWGGGGSKKRHTRLVSCLPFLVGCALSPLHAHYMPSRFGFDSREAPAVPCQSLGDAELADNQQDLWMLPSKTRPWLWDCRNWTNQVYRSAFEGVAKA